MAIKIIDRGPHKSVAKEVICRNCGATLEYTPNDVTERVERDYTGSADLVHVIQCPQCNNEQYVS